MNTAANLYDTTLAVTLIGQAIERRQPVHLIFLIDVSESMSDGKLDSVKKSIEFIASLLTPADMVSLITFGQTSQIVLNKGRAEDLLYSVGQMNTNGTTNLSAALMNLKTVLVNDGVRKQGVLLLTDGHANRGIYSPEGIKHMISMLLKDLPTVSITTIGYGDDHNAQLLEDIAKAGAGSYNIVYTGEDVATVFGEVLGGMTTVVAQNVVVRFPLGTTVKTGYATRVTDCIEVQVGDVYAENELVLLADVEPQSVPRIRITSHDMLTMESKDVTLVPEPADPIPRAIQMADLRYQVSEVLKLREPSKATPLLAQLRQLSLDPLVYMMIEDLERLCSTEPMNSSDILNMTQHSAFFALGRGLRSSDPTSPETRPAALSPFSNRMQRQMTARSP